MRHVWRWFGPADKVSLADARQAGARGIVGSLYHLPAGLVWTPEEIAQRQRETGIGPNGASTGLAWEVVESLPVSEAIKTRAGDWRAHIENYKISLANLAQAGLKVVCYNFMPILDWTRTDLAWRLDHGGTAMRFDLTDFAAFDLHVLRRPAAAAEFGPELTEAAGRRYAEMSEAARDALSRNIGAGLPGAVGRYSLEELRALLRTYEGVDAARLRANLIGFLEEVVPTAEKLGLRLCCHPDDPPFALLGLPRVMSTVEDYEAVLDAVPSPANGATFCTGSFGARPDNDPPAMARRLLPRTHFIHLRNVRLEGPKAPCSFYEDEHLEGGTDMVAVIAEILQEEARRAAEGREDAQIPMRPDHGQDILDDLTRGAAPGYPAIGRLKGLAELRGVERALSHRIHLDRSPA